MRHPAPPFNCRIPASDTEAPEDAAAAALAPIRSYLPPGVPAPLIQRGLMSWTGLFGVVSFELFGQLHQVVGEPPADEVHSTHGTGRPSPAAPGLD